MPIKTVVEHAYVCTDNKKFSVLSKALAWQETLDISSTKNLVTDKYLKLKGIEGRPAKIKRKIIRDFYEFLVGLNILDEERAKVELNTGDSQKPKEDVQQENTKEQLVAIKGRKEGLISVDEAKYVMKDTIQDNPTTGIEITYTSEPEVTTLS